MSEHLGSGYRGVMLGVIALGVLVVAIAIALISRGLWIDGLLLATAGVLLLRWYWRATQRQRELLGRGFYTGRRVGNQWVYEELQAGEVRTLEFTLGYVGRGEYELRIPGAHDWSTRMPDWARERRDEVIERLQLVFKRSQIHFDADTELTDTHG